MNTLTAPPAAKMPLLQARYCMANTACVTLLLAETGFALKKFTDIRSLIDAMEDRRLEELCDFIKKDEAAENN